MANTEAVTRDPRAFPREDVRRLRRKLLKPFKLRDLAGTWKGKLVDVLGLDGELELMLEFAGKGEVSGRFQMRIHHTHSVQELEGQLSGKVSGTEIELIHKGPREMGFRFLGQIKRTGQQRRELSMVGCYEVDSQARPGFVPMRGGTILLWKG